MTYESNQLAKYNSWLAHSERESNSSQYLIHYGIKGQKWGLRRWQNEDGSLTPAGKEHYAVGSGGNDRLHKKYGSQVKKLKKLDDRANVDLQKARAEKYNARAKKGAKAAVVLGTAGIGAGLGLEELRKAQLDLLNEKKAHKDSMSDHITTYKNHIHDLTEHGKYRNDHGDLATDQILSLRNARESKHIVGERMANKTFEIADEDTKLKNIRKLQDAASAGLYGAAAAAAAYAAYNKGKAMAAKYRTTEKGHAKAVAKRQEQYDKMFNMFKDTPYEELLKKQNKAS